MRLTLLAIPALTLSACAIAPQQTATPAASVDPLVAFEMPMDPGQVTCSQVNESQGLAELLTDWVSGQARVFVLRGDADVGGTVYADQISGYCSDNPDARVADIAPNVVGILN